MLWFTDQKPFCKSIGREVIFPTLLSQFLVFCDILFSLFIFIFTIFKCLYLYCLTIFVFGIDKELKSFPESHLRRYESTNGEKRIHKKLLSMTQINSICKHKADFKMFTLLIGGSYTFDKIWLENLIIMPKFIIAFYL